MRGTVAVATIAMFSHAAAGHGMGKLHPRDVGHADRAGDEIALSPELFGDKGDRRHASSSNSHAVTHGAGRTAASMPIGGNNRLTVGNHFVEHLVGDDRGGVVFVPATERRVGYCDGHRLLDLIEECFGVRESRSQRVRSSPERCLGVDRQIVRFDGGSGSGAWIEKRDHQIPLSALARA